MQKTKGTENNDRKNNYKDQNGYKKMQKRDTKLLKTV